MNVVAEIKPYLMLGSVAVRTPGFIRNNEITLVINAAKDFVLSTECIVEQIHVKCDDKPDAPLKNHFDSVAEHIYNEREKQGKVFVHCVAGISRSPSLVMAYLMKHEHMTLLEAFHLVREKRPFVRPNNGFWLQLIEYEKELRGHNTVTMEKCGSAAVPSVYKIESLNMVYL